MSKLTQENITHAFNNTYEIIGHDLGTGTIEKDDLICVCFDHIFNYGNLNKDQLKQWDALPLKTKWIMARKAFSYDAYELG